jgi:transposase
MGNPAGVKRNFDASEKRRKQAARLIDKGYSEAEVARRVGVHRQSVNRWAKQLAENGRVGSHDSAKRNCSGSRRF